jgi:uncharacterized repeat protein (TIGR03803 family)
MQLQTLSYRTERQPNAEDSMRTLNLSEILRMVLLVSCAAMPIAMPAQATFSVLVNFSGNDGDGANPYAGLVQGTDGNFYGTTGYGGTNNDGTVFKITPEGTLTTLHSFDGTDGSWPNVPLVQATNGDFYGTTLTGGANGGGTFFKITRAGDLATIYNFEKNEGTSVGLVQGTDGNFYGTTLGAGTVSQHTCLDGCGTVFKITPRGKLTTLHSFDFMDGAIPHAGLVQGTDGNFYGTTVYGGTNNHGTVFKITPEGTLTTLHSFDGTDGSEPNAPLVQARSGRFYGTTLGGGANHHCSTYGPGCGTVFEMTPAGKLTTIYSFKSTGEFENVLSYFAPAGLVQATDGNFYGTTYGGGHSECPSPGCGTVFKITPEGNLTTLHRFDGIDGSIPLDGLVQGTDGSFYGTTWDSSTAGVYGTVFSISVGLDPFVKTNPTSGKVGAVVSVLGSDLISTSSVTFNGTAATFIVVSNSKIRATVPTGATTGTLEVTTPSGRLKSNVPFRVTN